MRTHFTEIAVRQIKPSTTPYWDKTVPGFGIRVGKSTRTWVVMRGRSRERPVIGRYPDLTLSDARREAKQLLLIPPGPKIDSVSFEEAKRQFLDQNYRERSVRAKREATRLLTKHFSTLSDHPRVFREGDETHKIMRQTREVASEYLRRVANFCRHRHRVPHRIQKHLTTLILILRLTLFRFKPYQCLRMQNHSR